MQYLVQRAAIGSFGGFLQAIVGAVAEEQYVSVEIFVKYGWFHQILELRRMMASWY